MRKIPGLLLCLCLPACGAGGIAIAASGGGGGGGGGSAPPPRPTSTTSRPTDPLTSNYVPISYEVLDKNVSKDEDAPRGESDPRVLITPQYKTQVVGAKGIAAPENPFVSFWLPMTEADVATSEGTRGIPLGEHTFVWNAAADLGSYAGKVQVRIVPEYELSAGFSRKFKLNGAEFAMDNNEADTVLGADVVPFSDVVTFPVDLRATGGSLFAASLGGGIVERVNPVGVIDRLVGLGVPGNSGDGGHPGVARLGSLFGVEVDGAGNVYTLHDNRIRLTNTSTAPLQVGTLNLPADTIDRIQNDTGAGLALVNGRNLRVHPPTGAVIYNITDGSTSVTEIRAYNPEPLAGATITLGGVSIDPGFDGLIVGGGVDDSDGNLGTDTEVLLGLGLGVGPDGEIYFFEEGRHRVRVFNPGVTSVTVGGVSVAAGTVLTVAGGNGAGFSGDAGPAVAAQINTPAGIDVDDDRNLFIADLGNTAVRQVNLGAAPITFAGVTIAVGDIDTVMGGTDPDLKGQGSLAPETELLRPNAVAADDDGNILVADDKEVVFANGSAGTVTRYGQTVAAGRTVSVYDSSKRAGIPLVAPRAVHQATAGLTYFTDRSTVRAYSLLTTTFVLGAVRVDTGVTKVIAGGSVPGFSGDGGDAVRAAFSTPSALATDSARALYVADTGNDRIRFVNLNDASPLILISPVDVLGKSIASGQVETVVGGAVGPLPDDGDGLVASAAVLDGPMGVAFGAVNVGQGDVRALVIADTGNHRIRIASNEPSDITVLGVVVAPDTIQTIAGDGTPGFSPDGAGPWQVDTPTAVAIDNQGVIFFADSGNHRIRAINTSATVQRRAGVDIAPGEMRTIAGTGLQGRAGDGGLALDAALDTPQSLFIQTRDAQPVALYFADPPQQVIRMINLSDVDRFLRVDADGGEEITPAGGIKTLVGGPNTFGFPNAPAFGGDGQAQGEIRFANPWGITIIDVGTRASHLFVGDRGNNRFRRVGVRLVGEDADDESL